MSKIRRMFLGSNSSVGFYSLFEQVFSEDLNRYFIIKGGPGTGKSVFMKRIGESIESLGLDIEYYHCSSDCNSLDGVFVPKLKIALVDGTAPHIIEPKYPGLIDQILDFAQFLDRKQLLVHKKDIIDISKEASFYFEKAYIQLKQAALAFEEINLKYDRTINGKTTRDLICEIFKGAIVQSHTPPKTRKFFASAITPQGISKYYNTLIDDGMRVYSLKGFMGLDTKDILAKIAINAYELGFDIEIFYCPFRPSDIDMIIIPLLNIAVLDSSPPYNASNIPNNKSNEIVEIVISPDKPQTISFEQFNSFIDNAIANIGKAKSSHDALENIYSNAMNFNGIDKLYDNVLDIIKTQVEL